MRRLGSIKPQIHTAYEQFSQINIIIRQINQLYVRCELDGWWVEGCMEGLTGWSIPELTDETGKELNKQKLAELYNKLELITSMFYKNPGAYISVMTNALSLNGSFFNTQRMLQEYLLKAYFM